MMDNLQSISAVTWSEEERGATKVVSIKPDLPLSAGLLGQGFFNAEGD